MRQSLSFVSVIVSLLAAGTAHATVVWNGTFGSGSFNAWGQLQEVSSNRMQFVPNPAGSGNTVLQVEVYQGDNPLPGASGNRAEAEYDGSQPNEGDERFYVWSVYFPSSYVSADTWQLFTQFHQSGGDGSPPVQFFTEGNTIQLQISSVGVWQVPLELGVWHTFVADVLWSTSANTGYMTVYYDGQLSMQKTYGATMFAGQGVYIKQGLYRNADITQEQTVYHSGMLEGTTLADVWPTSWNTPFQSSAAPGSSPNAGTEDAGQPPEGTPAIAGTQDAGQAGPSGSGTTTTSTATGTGTTSPEGVVAERGGCTSSGGTVAWPLAAAVLALVSWRRQSGRREQVEVTTRA